MSPPFKKCIVKIGSVCVSGGNGKPLKVLRAGVMIRGGHLKSKSDYCILWQLDHRDSGGSHSYQISALLRGYEI